MIPRARFLVALTVSNVSKVEKVQGLLQILCFFSEILYFRQFSEIYRYLRGMVVSLLSGLLPKFFWEKRKCCQCFQFSSFFFLFLARMWKKWRFFSKILFLQAYFRKFSEQLYKSFQMYCVSFFQICFIFPMFFRKSFLRRVFESEINPKKQKLYKYFQDLALWLRRVFDYPRHRDDDSN